MSVCLDLPSSKTEFNGLGRVGTVHIYSRSTENVPTALTRGGQGRLCQEGYHGKA